MPDMMLVNGYASDSESYHDIRDTGWSARESEASHQLNSYEIDPMIKAAGTIEVVARNQKNFKLEGDDRWFGAFRQTQLNGAGKGDDVEFEYIEKQSGGTTFNNIQGNVTVAGRSGGNSGGGQSNGNRSGGSSGRPVAPKDKSDGLSKEEWAEKDRRIVRQNALSHATAVMALNYNTGDVPPTEELAEEAISLAKMFESYVYGES